MKKIIVDCPDEAKVIDLIIDAASEAGAGKIGNYSRCALITRGIGTWRSDEGANPYIGKVGEISQEESAKIEMRCPDDRVREVCNAIRKVHPYEEPVIDVIRLEEV